MDRVVPHRRAVHADEREDAHRAHEDVALDGDVLGLIAVDPRAEELQPGAAADVHRPAAAVLEQAPADGHLARAALHLRTGAAEALPRAEGAALNDAPVAADHVDCRAAVPPALDGAVLDAEVVDTRELYSIAVAARADVGDRQAAEGYMVRGRIEGAAVVDVQAVARLAGDYEVPELQIRDIRQVKRRPSPGERWSVLGVLRPDDDGFVGTAVEVLEVEPARILPRRHEYLVPRLRTAQGLPQTSDIANPYFLRRAVTSSQDQCDRHHGQAHIASLLHVSIWLDAPFSRH